MTDTLASSANRCAEFMATYLCHSTLWALLAIVVWFARRRLSGPLRMALWKAALVAPIVSATVVTVFHVPHAGARFSIVAAAMRFVEPTVVADRMEATQFGPRENRGERARWLSDARGAAAVSAEAAFAGRGERLGRIPPPVRATQAVVPASWWGRLALALVLVGVAGSCWATLRIAGQYVRLVGLQRRSVSAGAKAERRVRALAERMGVRRPVRVKLSSEVAGPVTSGIARPFILIPPRMVSRLSTQEFRALIAHELAHVIHGDAFWKLIGHIAARTFFYQPFNRVARRQLEASMEFAADRRAAAALGQTSALASCLMRIGELLAERGQCPSSQPLAVPMASFRSSLGQRVESLLSADSDWRPVTGPTRWAIAVTLIVLTATATLLAPRATAEPQQKTQTSNREGEQPMGRTLTTAALLTSVAIPGLAQEKTPQRAAALPKIVKRTADKLPEGAHRFNGMLLGRLVSKDVEKGTFVIHVDAVPRVWRNSKASNPKSLRHKNIAVDGVFGKWLDVLLLVKEGETLECETRHDGGDRLTFPGELLRKAAPYRPSNYPEIPEEFRGFKGAVAAKVVAKNTELLEIIVEVERVIDLFKGDAAKKPESIHGKRVMLGGFWQRKETYHGLKVGDRIELGLHHISRQSDHVSVIEFVRPAREGKPAGKSAGESASSAAFPRGMQGFNGMLIGKLLTKDVERGEFTAQVDAVTRVWRNSKARAPKSIVKRTVKIDGVSGKWLDVLLLVKKGETLEFEARHDGGDHLTFPGELMRKVAPYKPENYPVLPEAFRGFRGAVVATVVKRDAETLEMIVRVDRVLDVAKENRAEKPESIVGRKMLLAGFWRRKDDYHRLKVGDRIEVGLQHIGRQSDHLTVAGFVRKAR